MTTRAQIGFWLGGLIIFGILLFLLRDILLPFVAGMAVAYVLDPVADRLEAAGLSRTMATVLITILFVVITVGSLLLLLPIIYQQVTDLVSRVPAITDSI
ncbi:MAG: AI-2E family transporter, partial [Pseudomonadota bacterium]|nr:AI-2E family transporter [Pseudomonadota bacterium]